VTVPLSYAEELYALRTHIHMVAERLIDPGPGDRRRGRGDAAMTRPRVLVIGCGFGGIEAVRALSKADIEIILVDRTNHHLFQPLLYQVATAGLERAGGERADPPRAAAADEARQPDDPEGGGAGDRRRRQERHRRRRRAHRPGTT
jgi:NADPH-dependent 2,4-dienoyl-CoA reductase/sulfur reductase-like enzyme